MGMQIEETRIETLGRAECVERLMEIRGDRAHERAQCIGFGGCPHDVPTAGGRFPGRKRVSVWVVWLNS
jgi:hypothetical protein